MRCGRTDKIEILKLTVYPILQLEIRPVIHHAFYFDLLQRFLYLYLPYFLSSHRCLRLRVLYVFNPFQDVQDHHHYHPGHALRHGRYSSRYALLLPLIWLCKTH